MTQERDPLTISLSTLLPARGWWAVSDDAGDADERHSTGHHNTVATCGANSSVLSTQSYPPWLSSLLTLSLHSLQPPSFPSLIPPSLTTQCISA